MKRWRVLVVDDDPSILEVLGMRLEATGYEPTLVADPEAARRLVADRRFDAALFDLRMEPLDGIALARIAHEHQPRLPVLIMTAHGTIASAVEAIKDGCFDFLTKPFVPDELRTKLGRAVAERRWARDRRLLLTVGETLAASGSTTRVLDTIVAATLEATETERAVLFLLKDGRPVARARAGASPTPLDHLAAAAAAAMKTGVPSAIPEADGRVTLAAPLVVRGVPEGALVVENPSYVLPTEDDLELLTLFAAHVVVALRNTRELGRLRGSAVAALGRIANQVGHELNNPLGGLRIFTRLVQDRFEKAGDAQGVGLAHKIERTVTRLAELASDIAAYGEPPELKREPASPNALVEDCLDAIEPDLADKRVRVVRDLDATVGTLPLDARQLRRALGNLLTNALDALEPGGVLTIRTARLEDGGVEIAVCDDGCGMDDETRGRVFELFFTTKTDGTGLGMPMVRAVIERHGGQIEIDTAPARGTAIRLTLPAAAA